MSALVQTVGVIDVEFVCRNHILARATQIYRFTALHQNIDGRKPDVGSTLVGFEAAHFIGGVPSRVRVKSVKTRI